MSERSKLTKEQADYAEGRPEEHCGICRHFVVVDSACTRVRGHILARMWCKLFEHR